MSIGQYIQVRIALSAVEAVIQKKVTTSQIMHLANIMKRIMGRCYYAVGTQLRHVIDIKKDTTTSAVGRAILTKLKSTDYPHHFVLRTKHVSNHFGGGISISNTTWHTKQLARFRHMFD
jgi:hypothetical protein